MTITTSAAMSVLRALVMAPAAFESNFFGTPCSYPKHCKCLVGNENIIANLGYLFSFDMSPVFLERSSSPFKVQVDNSNVDLQQNR